jgi:hypothetical protein
MTGKERSQRWRDRRPKLKPQSERDRLREEERDQQRIEVLMSLVILARLGEPKAKAALKAVGLSDLAKREPPIQLMSLSEYRKQTQAWRLEWHAQPQRTPLARSDEQKAAGPPDDCPIYGVPFGSDGRRLQRETRLPAI